MPTDNFIGKSLSDCLTYTKIFPTENDYLKDKVEELKADKNELLTKLCQTENKLRTVKKEVELPKHYIINDGATILFWKDGTKTIVKRASDDEFNPRLAFLTAFFQRYCGMSKNKANKYLASLQIEVKKENSKSCKSKELRVGDKVFVKKNLKDNTVYGADMFVDSMSYLKGKEVTIKKVLDDGCYRIEEASYNWTKEMFDLRTIKHKEEK